MRVLNIDLDFFLNDRVMRRPDNPSNRPDDLGLVPWPAYEVTKFLEKSLNFICKTPGRIVQSHHEVFYLWRDLVEQNQLTVPFAITHVDAHSDLGCGMPGWDYLHSDFLELPLDARRRPLEGEWGLNFASYMAFAIGNRWFSEIDFIVPPYWQDDIPLPFLVPNAPLYKPGVTLNIEMMYACRAEIQACINGSKRFADVRRSIGEPNIPLNIIAQAAVAGRYTEHNWDYVFLARSPGYTPTSADALIPVIARYIDSENLDVRMGKARTTVGRRA